MLKVAICDDDNIICAQIENILDEYDKIACIGIEQHSFTAGQELLDFIQNNHPFDLIFLDIVLITTTGVAVGSIIRNEFDDHISKIVFISALTGYESALFDVQPLNFLRKPLDKDKLLKCVALAINILDLENSTFQYKVSTDIKHIRTKNILYFESVLKKVKIISTDGEDYFYGSLDNVKHKLPGIFFTPHRSFLANYNHVEIISGDHLLMSNGDSLPISRSNLKAVRDFQMNVERKMFNGAF